MIAFAHLSDTHFGPRLANQGRGLVWGQRPHHVVKCLALPAAFEAACDLMDTPFDGSALPLVLSGDLTVSGAYEEQAVAQAFLRGRFPISRQPGSAFEMGLGRRSERMVSAVAGNHDHWGGNRATMPAYNRAIYPHHFRPTPWRKTLTSADGHLTLELVGLDSNSGWAPGQANQIVGRARGAWAQGSIAAHELAQMEGWFQQGPVAQPRRAAQVVRAVVCHHSLSFRSKLLGREEMDRRSRDRLLQSCADHAVSAVLTGHTHDATHHTFRPKDRRGNTVACHELRAAHAVGFGKTKRDDPAEDVGFLTHRLTRRDDGGVQWDTWRWYWSADRRYHVKSLDPWHSFTARVL